MVRLLGFDLTHKLRIIFHSNCSVQLTGFREITKTSSRHPRIEAETLTRLPCKHVQGVLLVVSWNCSFYSKSPQNNQHQDQANLRFHGFLYYWAQLNLRKTNWEMLFMIWSLRIKIVPEKIWQFLKITSKILELHRHCFMSHLSLEPETTYPSEISQWYLPSRSSTDEGCRAVLLFIPYRSRVIHALPWGKRLLHYEWQCTLQTFLYVNMVSLTTKQFTMFRANIFSSPSGLVHILS